MTVANKKEVGSCSSWAVKNGTVGIHSKQMATYEEVKKELEWLDSAHKMNENR